MSKIPTVIGDPISTEGRKKFYAQFRIGEEDEFSIGDCARFSNPTKSKPPFIGRIVRIYTLPESPQEVQVTVQWYYRAAETTLTGEAVRRYPDQVSPLDSFPGGLLCSRPY